MEMNLLEIVGWVATFVVIGSFLVNDMLKLRSINLVGATLWLIYGIIASSYSIMFLNIVVMSIQIFKISKLLKEKKKL
jgi:hypothetical protein|tara:strand:+ start:410 stop:643 length:234 start_codon:yes stop_codon:yes gene_type:complete